MPGREGRRHVVLPYAFDTNDMRFQRGGGFVFGDDFARYCIDAFDRLYREGGDAPRMLSVGLHLRIVGPARRIGGLERFLAMRPPARARGSPAAMPLRSTGCGSRLIGARTGRSLTAAS